MIGLEAALTYIFTGRQEHIRARSERAFLLLQRILAVEPETRVRWKTAHKQGEVACERLGSVVLLSQGIYAFKVNATGARTDLVFAEPPPENLLWRGVEGLVLTEWKVATSGNATARFREARKQADLYRQGPLAGSELTGFRYLIAVSLKALAASSVPADETSAAGITYRHVNIVIEPDVPSKAAKKRSA